MNTKITLPQYVQNALLRLVQSGFEAYAVGGCVRDCLLGREVYDYDITTSAQPSEVKAVFGDCVTIDTGLKHGTVTVVWGSEHLEITTFRTDGEYSDGRHPDCVKFGKNLHDDLCRRDFGINAMAFNPQVGLVDDWGGLDDLRNRQIRCVGEADRRFGEDALRILRALRFASVLGFDIEQQTKKSIHENLNLIEKVSAERVFAELKKLLAGQNAHAVVREFGDALAVVMPCVADYSPREYDAMCRMLELAPTDYVARLMVVLSFASTDGARQTLARLKCDNKTKARVTACVDALGKVTACDLHSACVEACELGLCVVEDASVIRLWHSMALDDEKNTRLWHQKAEFCRKIRQEHLCVSVRELNINGSDIVAEGIAQGCVVGEVLGELVRAVIDAKVQNERTKLLDYARKMTGGNAR